MNFLHFKLIICFINKERYKRIITILLIINFNDRNDLNESLTSMINLLVQLAPATLRGVTLRGVGESTL